MIPRARIARSAPVRAQTQSVPAPVKGWNTRDPLAAMDPLYAVILDNWFPEAGQCKLRRGFSEHATGVGSGNVESLLEYNGLTGNKLFAAGGGAIYDVTTAGTATSAVSGFTGNQWNGVNIGTAGGQFLWICNGVDGLRTYNGSSWSTPSVTGPTAADVVWVTLHHRRLFFGEKNKLSFWYLPVNSISGTATEFSLAGVARRGGYIQGLATWTRDGGAGMEDVAVFVTSEGEAIVYQGIDPDSASDWSLVGTYRIGKPIGRRFWCKLGSEAVLITEDGILPMSEALKDRSASGRVALSDAISPTVNQSVRDYGALFGWQPMVYPRGGYVLVNVPISAGTTYYQYVWNSITGAWCRFTGQNAVSWGILDDELYFGGTDGGVYKADTGVSDDGENIVGDLKPAFSYFGSRGAQKLFKLARPVWGTTGTFQAVFNLNVDFEDEVPSGTATASAAGSAVWDSAIWDTAVWAGDESISKSWQTVTGVGYAAALRTRVATNSLSITLKAVDYVFEPGGVL